MCIRDRVTGIKEFGAFVEYAPGKEGLVQMCIRDSTCDTADVSSAVCKCINEFTIVYTVSVNCTVCLTCDAAES